MPSPEQKSPWAPPEDWERPEAAATTESTESTVNQSLQAGKVHVIPEDQFKGNPTRVIGHPSNPTTEMAQAMAERGGAQQAEQSNVTPEA